MRKCRTISPSGAEAILTPRASSSHNFELVEKRSANPQTMFTVITRVIQRGARPVSDFFIRFIT